MDFSHISFEDLDNRIKAQKLIHSYVDDLKFEELKEQLVSKVNQTRFQSAEDLLNFRTYNSACGCMGPSEGFTLCPCAMYNALETYRFHLAKYLKSKQESL